MGLSPIFRDTILFRTLLKMFLSNDQSTTDLLING
jgi:hypothetical protein